MRTRWLKVPRLLSHRRRDAETDDGNRGHSLFHHRSTRCGTV